MKYQATRNDRGEKQEFEDLSEAIAWIANFLEGHSFFPEESIEAEEYESGVHTVYVTVEGDDEPTSVGEVVELED